MEIVLSVRAHGALTTLKGCTQPEAQEDSSSPYEAKDELRTVLAPSRLLLSSVSVPSEFSSDPAHPIQQFEISVLDAAGALVHSGAYRIHVHVSGGELLGLESGDLRDDTDYKRCPQQPQQHPKLQNLHFRMLCWIHNHTVPIHTPQQQRFSFS